jgi:hypothetical protein
MMRRFWFLILLFPSCIAGQTRKYVNEFNYIGVGGRQFGMGKAGVASTNDIYSAYWNPAGLAEMEDNLQVGFMHNYYFQNIANFDYLALGVKSGKDKAFSISLLRFGVDGILNTLDLIRNGVIDYNRVTEFSAVDYAINAGYAQKKRMIVNYNTVMSWGANVKIIHRRVGEFARSWGFGADAAFRLTDYNNRWGFSVVARDITTTFNNWIFEFSNNQKDVYALTGNSIPQTSLELALPRFCTGGFYRFKEGKLELLGELNLDLTTDGKRNTLISSDFLSGDVRMGIEAGLNDEDKGYKLMFRTGLYNFQRETRQSGKFGLTVQPTVGLGIVYNRLSLDYALAGFGASGTGLYSNIISLGIGINKTDK